MKFYNREKELGILARLSTLSRTSSHMVVVTGRRRVGKTELIRQFSKNKNNILYLFVSKKKPHVLLEEFKDILATKIPLLQTVSFDSFDDFFLFIINYMKEHPMFLVFDEFQNFENVDPSVFSIIQNQWDTNKDNIKGGFIFIGSVYTLMRRIFEGKKEPLFGRATSKLFIDPLDPDAIADILYDYNIDASAHLPFYFMLFGGIPKYYFLLDRYRLFNKASSDIIKTLYCEINAPLQNEGKELLIEEFGKNYYLYFSILQVIAGGETQMARIADGTGININSISKYLEELTSFYQVLERRVPVTEYKQEKKIGRYFIKDPALKFWFRYIFKNQSLIEIGDINGLTNKILDDLSTFMGKSFEELVRELLLKRNIEGSLPFKFNKIGGFWTRKGGVEIDIAALDEDKGRILFGECKLNGNKFKKSDINQLKENARYVKWNIGKRKEDFALFSMHTLTKSTREFLKKEEIFSFDLKELLKKPSKV